MSARPNVRRRVYNLPHRMHDRILAFMQEQHLANETEAAIRLLAAALADRDTAADIVDDANAALRGGQSPEAIIHMLCVHPLARVMEKDPDSRPPRWWRWTLVTGQRVRLSNGELSHEAAS